MTTARRIRRTQEERTAETRNALMDASVRVIERLGYAGATTALIADEAGVSRGAILHHFGTRAQLMADVVSWVYEREGSAYLEIERREHVGDHPADWPSLVWEVLSRPSGVAVLEILQATRNDPELAAMVLPMQQAVEETALRWTMARFDLNRATAAAMMRLIVWTIRGLSIEKILIADPQDIRHPLRLLSQMLARAAPNGVFESDFLVPEI